VGALAALPAYGLDDWSEELLEDESASTEARHLLEQVFANTRAALASDQMEFAPLLPEDDAPLKERVAALAGWCAGFLYGIGVGTIPLDQVPGDVGEILRDFAEISRAEVGREDSLETNEEAYLELVEYVRAGAQLIYEELEPSRTQALAGQGQKS
jgi:uncharacterized protein YgfB (UPF0149 family)